MIHFLAVGDWGRRGSPAQRRVAAAMATVADDVPAHFILSTGDNFYEYGIRDLHDVAWWITYESVYLHHSSLRVPWYVALGNHDYQGNIDAQVAKSEHHSYWTLPHRYYDITFDSGVVDLHLIVLDTTPLLSRHAPGGCEPLSAVASADTAAVQLAWLRNVLQRSSAQWTILVGHHPVLTGRSFHRAEDELHEMLTPFFDAFSIDLYLCGHEHDLQHLTRDGNNYLISGGGAEWRPTTPGSFTTFCAASLGFTSIVADRYALQIRFFDDETTCLHYDTIEHRSQAAA